MEGLISDDTANMSVAFSTSNSDQFSTSNSDQFSTSNSDQFSTSNSDQFSADRTVAAASHREAIAQHLIPQHYQLERCTQWILHNDFSMVALQFPDELLGDAAPIALWLHNKTGRRFFVLADTSFGSCCVDEIAAQHANADSIVHFGHACLSATSRLPVYFVFPDRTLDVARTSSNIAGILEAATADNLVVFCDVVYQHALDELCESLSCALADAKCRIVPASPRIQSCRTESAGVSETPTIETGILVVLNRAIPLPASEFDAASVVFIGAVDSVTATCLAMTLNGSEALQRMWLYDPAESPVSEQLPRLESSRLFRERVTRLLRRRRHLVERARDARRVGIVLGTLSVSRYLSMVSLLRQHLTAADKRHYTLLLGSPTDVKLANFAELDALVLVACPESALVDAPGRFLQPLVTPFEMIVACSRHPYTLWPGDAAYISQFSALLEHNLSPSADVTDAADVTDVSLITGRLRWLTADQPSSDNTTPTALALRPVMATVLHSDGAAGKLLERQWHGLEPRLGQTPVTAATCGHTGIATGYTSITHTSHT